MSALSSNIRYQGATMLASGELLFSDGYSDRILTFDPSGTVSDVNAHRPQFKPTALAAGPENRIFVINQGDQELAVFDRIGDVVRTCPLPAPVNRVAVDDSANTYLLDRAGTQVWQITRRNQVRRVTASELGISARGIRYRGPSRLAVPAGPGTASSALPAGAGLSRNRANRGFRSCVLLLP